MELSRIGANRKEVRSTAFADRKPELSIDNQTGAVKLAVRYAEGMGTQGHYDYTVTLTPEDLSSILRTLSTERSAFQPGSLQAALESCAAPLLRLLAAASILPFQLAPTELQLKFKAAKEKLALKRAAEGEA